MKAKELAMILLQNPDQEIIVRYSESVRYSELTWGEEDQLVSIEKEAVFEERDRIIIAADLGEKLCS